MMYLAAALTLLLAPDARARSVEVSERQLLQTIGDMPDTLTAPTDEFNLPMPPECTSAMAGCTGTFATKSHDVAGDVTVIDDCTFRIQNWEFDGEGPAVEWWAATASGPDTTFPYPETAMKIGELGEPGSYVAGGSVPGGSSDITIRLGKDAQGNQILLSPELNHISLWCEEFEIDFGNAKLTCDNAGGPAAALDAAAAPATGPAPAPTDTATGTDTAAGTGTTAAAPPATDSTSGPADGTPSDTTSTSAGDSSAGSEAAGQQAPAQSTPTDAAHHVASALLAVVAGAMAALAL